MNTQPSTMPVVGLDLAAPTAQWPRAAQTPRPRVASITVLQGQDEIEIDHHGTLYRLRVTALNKLILTK